MSGLWIDPYHPTPGAPMKGPPDDGMAGLGVALADTNRHGAVLILPGGGYETINVHEGLPIARFFNQRGLHAFILRYRHWPTYRYPVPLKDAHRAVKVIRYGVRAGWWPVSPDKVAVMGFGAGGHLAALLATDPAGAPEKQKPLTISLDEIESEPSRPDAHILAYPLIQLSKDADGAAAKLIGRDSDFDTLESLDADQRVTPETPPAFVFHRATETNIPVAHSLAYAFALAKHGIPLDLHCLDSAKHSLGLASEFVDVQAWPDLAVRWLKGMGF